MSGSGEAAAPLLVPPGSPWCGWTRTDFDQLWCCWGGKELSSRGMSNWKLQLELDSSPWFSLGRIQNRIGGD